MNLNMCFFEGEFCEFCEFSVRLAGILSIHPTYPNTEVDKIAEASDTEFYLSPANAWNYACENCLKDI